MKRLLIPVGLCLVLIFAWRYTVLSPSEESSFRPQNDSVKLDSMTQVLVEDYDGWLRHKIDGTSLPGVAIAIVKDSVVAFQKAYGVKNSKKPRPINEHSIFRVASLSKCFAGVLTGLLVQEGVLSWDDKVISYVPNFKLRSSKYTKQVTIRHLLSHTTGLPRHTYSNLLNMGVSYDKIKAQLDEVKIAHAPGQHYNYQNVVFSVIAEVLEAATGKTYETLLEERIFNPIGMEDASASFEAISAARNVALPHSHTKEGVKPIDISPKYYEVVPAAGVNASITDMSQWLLFLMGNREWVASETDLAKIYEPQISMSTRERGVRNWKGTKAAHYAFGWRVLDYKGKRVIYHGGYVNGYRAEIGFIPEEKIGMVFLSNSTSRLAFECMPAFFDLYLSIQNFNKKNISQGVGN